MCVPATTTISRWEKMGGLFLLHVTFMISSAMKISPLNLSRSHWIERERKRDSQREIESQNYRYDNCNTASDHLTNHNNVKNEHTPHKIKMKWTNRRKRKTHINGKLSLTVRIKSFARRKELWWTFLTVYVCIFFLYFLFSSSFVRSAEIRVILYTFSFFLLWCEAIFLSSSKFRIVLVFFSRMWHVIRVGFFYSFTHSISLLRLERDRKSSQRASEWFACYDHWSCFLNKFFVASLWRLRPFYWLLNSSVCFHSLFTT